ncbi:peptidoglycan-binding domain-containing protein [Labrys miyagiensis]|uniref:peptidoglycan-binding domain-containing protein n=1 Tax=Labrys miyagiensis TaxID=346912 RepID=UPI0024E12B82|nr:hypothetical protein [Labrys miyagiensis]
MARSVAFGNNMHLIATEQQSMAYTMKINLTGMQQVYNVSYPVGLGMPNNRDDVLLVQTLMKLANFTRFTPALGPVENSASIKIDGYFGPQTKRMIKAFEDYYIGLGKLMVSDGIVESAPRDGYTHSGVLYKIIHLNRAVQEQRSDASLKFLPFSSDTHPILRASLIKNAEKPEPPRPF